MADDDPHDPPPTDPPADPDDAALVAEVDELTRPQADTDRDKVKHALIAAKRDLRSANRRVKELEPIAARATDINTRLDRAAPIIDAIMSNPKLRAEALRSANGTRTSSDATEQPEDDAEASAFAENVFGFYLADGSTPDVARARRAMDLMDRRTGRQTDERIRPLAGMTLGRTAEENVRQALAATDDDGVPLASPESLRETITMLGGPQSPMLANPQVVDLLLNNAIGLDKRKGRTPKAQDEPLYLEQAGSGRGRRSDAIDPELRESFARLGIDEKQGSAAVKRLEEGAIGRKGIALGVK